MNDLNWSMQQIGGDAAWITTYAASVPKARQIVLNTTTGKYAIGDGTTAISALTFYGGISASGLTVGTTTITGGANTKVLYNNNGVVGEYAVLGTGSVVLDSTLSSYLTTSAAALAYQPLDSDLTSWASVTRASGFDTFVATSSSANLKALVTDETGSGALCFATSPVFTTDVTTPLIIGGSAVGSVIQYKGTSGNGTSTVAAHQFLVGNNGATTAMSILNTAMIGIGGVTAPVDFLQVGSASSFKNIKLGYNSVIGANTNDTVALGNLGGNALGYYMPSDGAGHSELVNRNSSGILKINSYQALFTQTGKTGTGVIPYEFVIGSNTNQTLSTNIPNFKVTGSTKQWATGLLGLQEFNTFTSNTISFVGASTTTLAANMSVAYVQGGTNATITTSAAIYVPTLALTNTTTGIGLFVNAPSGAGTNYAARFNGVTDFLGNIRLTQTVTTEALVSDTSVTIVINGTTYKLLAKA
jgi:hypothetical protein